AGADGEQNRHRTTSSTARLPHLPNQRPPGVRHTAAPGCAARRAGGTMGIVRRAGIIRFRHNAALTVAAVVALVGALPVAASSPWLAPIPLVPLAVAVWAWRAGTDADRHGLQVRALLGSRRLPWARIAQLVPTGHGRVS